jgi:hypothetical protein
MLKETFKKRVTVAEATEMVERLGLLETYHWSRAAHHRRVHDKIAKRRRSTESRLRSAEKALIEAMLEEE